MCNLNNKFILFDEEFKFDFTNHILYKEDEEIELTKKEILFLEFFSKNVHHVATYSKIEEYVWEGEETNLVNIRTMIKRLRKKLPVDSIHIIKGLGYSLSKNVKLI